MNKKAIFNAATKLRPTGNKINQRNSKLRMLKCTFSEREKKRKCFNLQNSTTTDYKSYCCI